MFDASPDAGKIFVHFLYQMPAFDAFDDFYDFVESITCETSKSCQVRGSNPCRTDRDRLCVDPEVCGDAGHKVLFAG